MLSAPQSPILSINIEKLDYPVLKMLFDLSKVDHDVKALNFKCRGQ